MSDLLVITNEKKEIIYKQDLRPSTSPLPLILAYASLEMEDAEYYNGYSVHKYLCLPGHLLILVTDNVNFPLKEFFVKIESFLSEELNNPLVDDNSWLSKDLSEKIRKLYEKY